MFIEVWSYYESAIKDCHKLVRTNVVIRVSGSETISMSLRNIKEIPK
jgi:hypothetical protein